MFILFRLFAISNATLNKSLTIQRLRDLFDNYEADASKPEKQTADEVKEQDAFIDAVLNTKVMKLLMEFLVKKQWVGRNWIQ